MCILVVLTDKEVQSNPSRYQETVRYLKGKYADLSVKITGRCGITSISGDFTHDIDVVIMSDSHRLSIFDLFESTYAEYVFTSKPVLNCSMKELDFLITSALKRERRYGK